MTNQSDFDEDTYKEIRRECDLKLAKFAAENEALRHSLEATERDFQVAIAARRQDARLSKDRVGELTTVAESLRQQLQTSLDSERLALRNNEDLRKQLSEMNMHQQLQDSTTAAVLERAEAAEAECLEQCRLLGIGGEREARLIAENAALKEREQAITALCNYAKVAHPSELLQKLGEAQAENAALLDWERRCADALGVPGCHPEEMLHVVDSLREDAERYRWLTEDHDDPLVRDKCREILRRMPTMSYGSATAAIDAARKK